MTNSSFFSGNPTPNQLADLEALAAQVEATAASVFEANSDAAQSALDAAGQATTATGAASAALGSKTSAEAAAANANADRVAAQTARTGAETAKSGADTAKAGADAAKTASEAARDLAQGYRDNALTYRNEALGFRNEAEGFKNAAATFDPANFYTKTEVDANTFTRNQSDTRYYQRSQADARYVKLSGANALDTRPTFAGNTPWDTGNFDPNSYYTKTEVYTKAQVDGGLSGKANLGSPTFTGTVTFRDPTANYVAFWDENWGIRHIHFNDGNIGFLNNGGGWTWRSGNDGSTWQGGTLYVGNTTLGTDGNLLLAWRGQWLSDYLGYIEGRANGAQGAADARVHRIQFAGRSEWDNQTRVAEFPTVLCDAWWNGWTVCRRAATAQMHIPDQGGWVNVWA